jgi:hypothetical protein
MEIERQELEFVAMKICAILDKTTLLEKGIKLSNLEQFMWIHKKQNYDKHVEQIENWKDIDEEKDWASKARLVTLFLMD